MQMVSYNNSVFLFNQPDSDMELQRQRHYLTIATACLLLFSAAIVLWSVSTVDESSPQSPSVQLGQVTTPDVSRVPELTIPTTMTARQLRGPLYDPEPPPAAPPQPKPPVVPRPKVGPKLDLSLVGTIIEPNNSLAIIADANGEFDVKGVGETLELAPDGLVITSIESEQVTLKHQGKTATLSLDRKQKKNKSTNGNRTNRKRGLK
jgi:type II secretory pathway component PulC